MPTAELTIPRPVHRWNVVQFTRLKDAGFLPQRGVELIDGIITDKDAYGTIPEGELPTWRWDFDQYMRMTEAGLLPERGVELIDGEILDMAAQKYPHAICVSKSVRVLMEMFPEPMWVKVESTLRFSDLSAPEPDVALLPRIESDPQAALDPLLIVEVSDTSLDYDRGEKAELYAAHRVPDYWIINIRDRVVEVHRNPVKDSSSRFGWRYAEGRIIHPGESFALLAAPDRPIEIARLMP
jgi:Uma2 family endonuclease